MNQSKSLTGWQVYKRLLAYTAQYWPAFTLSIIGNLIFAASQGVSVEFLKYIIDAIEQQNKEYISLIPVVSVLLIVMRGIGAFLGAYFIAYVAGHVVLRLRAQMFSKIMHQPAAYFDKTSSGNIVSLFTFNSTQVSSAASDSITIIVREGLTVLVLMGYLLYSNWMLTVLLFGSAPVIALVVKYTSKRFKVISHRIQNVMGVLTHTVKESVVSQEVIKLNGMQDGCSNSFNELADYTRRQQLKMIFTQSLATPVVQLVVAIFTAVIIWIALAKIGNFTAGEFIAFITAAGMLLKPIRQLTNVNSTLQTGVAAAESLFELLDKADESDCGTYTSPRINGKIEFKDVSFRYQSEQDDVLKNISFSVEPGSTVAIVGRSGSGKSTLAKLIPRFYQASCGEILIDGVSIDQYQLKSLRENIALVGQNPIVFDDTALNNITYGSEQVSEETVRQVATQAQAISFIDALPDGFNSPLGEDGSLISGGQRQRIVIARAILKDAPILLLDEATSALDNEAEYYIQKALNSVMEGRTTVIIAHRLSTIEHADQILVMDKGLIVERGTHTELLAAKGYYTQLYERNFQD